LASRPEDDRAWAVLALCQTLLGHYRFAVTAYQRALACAPKNPWYAHNLGHLLDVALGRGQEAVHWLKTAYASAPAHAEIAASYAHALARAGKLSEARRVLVRAMKRGASREHTLLWKWLERGAPADEDVAPPRGAAADGGALPPPLEATPAEGVPASGRVRVGARKQARALALALERGLSSLPLHEEQRARARALARDALDAAGDASDDPAMRGLAAAIAYAIVCADGVPLTQAEVAAPFRVSVARLRGRFARLRARLVKQT
jgi:predicted Zn-dependent protease